MDGLFSPQEILKTLLATLHDQIPLEIRLDDDLHVYTGFLVSDEDGKHGQSHKHKAESGLHADLIHFKGIHLSPVEPAFGNARIQQSPHVYVQFLLGKSVMRCMLKVLGQTPHNHLMLHHLSFPEALLRFSNRKEKRTRLSPEIVMTALIQGPGHREVMARVLDVSRQGIAIQFPSGTSLFNREAALNIEITSSVSGKMLFAGKVKHYSPVPHTGLESGNLIQCGIQVEPTRDRKGDVKKWEEMLAMAERREMAFRKLKKRELLLRTK